MFLVTKSFLVIFDLIAWTKLLLFSWNLLTMKSDVILLFCYVFLQEVCCGDVPFATLMDVITCQKVLYPSASFHSVEMVIFLIEVEIVIFPKVVCTS